MIFTVSNKSAIPPATFSYKFIETKKGMVEWWIAARIEESEFKLQLNLLHSLKC